MSIPLQCHECSKKYKVSDEFAGRKFRCKNCDAVLRVPQLDAMEPDDDNFDWDLEEVQQAEPVPRARQTKHREPVPVDRGRQKAHPLVFWGSLGCGVMLVFVGLIGFTFFEFANFFEARRENKVSGVQTLMVKQQEAFDAFVMKPLDLTPHTIPLLIDVPADVKVNKDDRGAFLYNDAMSLRVVRARRSEAIARKIKQLTKQKQDSLRAGKLFDFNLLDANTLRISQQVHLSKNEVGYLVYAIVEVGEAKYLVELMPSGFESYTLEQSEVMLVCIRSLRPAKDDKAVANPKKDEAN